MSKLAGPPAKEGFCCDRDREISKGEEISIVDAFKTTDGGKASYITYVIRLGVSVVDTPRGVGWLMYGSHIRLVDDIRRFCRYIKL